MALHEDPSLDSNSSETIDGSFQLEIKSDGWLHNRQGIWIRLVDFQHKYALAQVSTKFLVDFFFFCLCKIFLTPMNFYNEILRILFIFEFIQMEKSKVHFLLQILIKVIHFTVKIIKDLRTITVSAFCNAKIRLIITYLMVTMEKGYHLVLTNLLPKFLLDPGFFFNILKYKYA